MQLPRGPEGSAPIERRSKMKKFILAVAMAASALTAMPATAIAQDRGDDNGKHRDDHGDNRGDNRGDDHRDHGGEDHRDHRGEDHRDDRRDARQDAWRGYNRYDYNRPDAGQGRYYADRYYRDGRYYRPVRLTRNDRVYRGYDNRYYCRRSDGTTGLIIGGIAGGLIGNRIDRGGSGILGTLLGAGAGAAIGSLIDRGQVVCR
jgi:hypothetical protein